MGRYPPNPAEPDPYPAAVDVCGRLMQQQPHDVAVGQRADLDEVAELVGQPQAPAGAVFELRAGAAGQRLLEAAAVADLADDHAVLVPDAQRALAAAVADAVGRDLVGREHEVAGAHLADAGLARVLGDERRGCPRASPT